MIETRELITICRQIGSMMQAGVDILHITRVLRAQTDNARLLSLYDDLDHDLRMGKGLAEAMERASDVFSPFAIQLIRAGEERNNIAGAFIDIANFLQQEEEARLGIRPPEPADAGSFTARPIVPSVLTVSALDGLIDRLQVAALRTLTIAAGLLLTLAAVWWSVEEGWIEERWLSATLYSVAALFIGGAGVWVRRRLEADRRREIHCSFCGAAQKVAGPPLQRAPRFAGAAICADCANIIAYQSQVHHSLADTPPPPPPVAEIPAPRHPMAGNAGASQQRGKTYDSVTQVAAGDGNAPGARNGKPTKVTAPVEEATYE
jgi:hypothetical protein